MDKDKNENLDISNLNLPKLHTLFKFSLLYAKQKVALIKRGQVCYLKCSVTNIQSRSQLK